MDHGLPNTYNFAKIDSAGFRPSCALLTGTRCLFVCRLLPPLCALPSVPYSSLFTPLFPSRFSPLPFLERTDWCIITMIGVYTFLEGLRSVWHAAGFAATRQCLNVLNWCRHLRYLSHTCEVIMSFAGVALPVSVSVDVPPCVQFQNGCPEVAWTSRDWCQFPIPCLRNSPIQFTITGVELLPLHMLVASS